MATASKRTLWKHASALYRRRTLLHPAHVVALAVLILVGLVTLDVVVAVIGLLFVELSVIVFVPRLSCVRRAIEASMQRREHAAAAAARAGLLGRMSEDHRRELLDLEGIATLVRERCGIAGEADDGVERLIELYVRLAIAHRTTGSALEAVGRAHPDEALRHLESHVTGGSEVERAAVERRLSILRLRCDARRVALERQEAIGHDLAAIGDTLRWMHASCGAPAYEMLREELERALAARDRDAATLLELAALRDDDFDAEVIALGRAGQSDTGSEPRLRVAPVVRYQFGEAFPGLGDLPAVATTRRA